MAIRSGILNTKQLAITSGNIKINIKWHNICQQYQKLP